MRPNLIGKGFECASAKNERQYQHSPFKVPDWSFHSQAQAVLTWRLLNMQCKLEGDSLQVQSDIAYLNVHRFHTLSETGWHQEQELNRFDMQSVGNDCGAM